MAERSETELDLIPEQILYDYDARDRPAGLELVERADLLMWTRPSPTKWSSSVRLARWSEAEADDRISEVLAFFRARGRPFVWHVGPSCAPADLDRRLEAHGLVRESVTQLLIAPLPVIGLRANAQVRILDARTSSDVAAYLRFGHPEWSEEEVRSEVADRLRFLALYGDRGGFLLAYLGDEAVANAAWRDSSDGRAIYLTGAGTREQHRRRGVYQMLTQYRLERAITRGCQYAVIQAQLDTSMPILRRRGFRPAGSVSVFSWDVSARGRPAPD